MEALNILFHFAHLSVMFFSALGWILPITRTAHLILQSGVLFSWFVLGYWKGWTYCVLTDYHWRVRRKLGIVDKTDSYVKYVVDKVSGMDISHHLIDLTTVSIYFATTIIALYLFFVKK